MTLVQIQKTGIPVAQVPWALHSDNPRFLWSEVPWASSSLAPNFPVSLWPQFSENLTGTPGMWSPGSFCLWHHKTSEIRKNGPSDPLSWFWDLGNVWTWELLSSRRRKPMMYERRSLGTDCRSPVSQSNYLPCQPGKHWNVGTLSSVMTVCS